VNSREQYSVPSLPFPNKACVSHRQKSSFAIWSLPRIRLFQHQVLILIYYMFLSMLLIFNSKLYLFALFVIDQESPVCDQVNLCLYLSNKVGS
jgi:hypothetical protein